MIAPNMAIVDNPQTYWCDSQPVEQETEITAPDAGSDGRRRLDHPAGIEAGGCASVAAT